jgi:4,5-DOPA dioxygenase extradiol
MRRHILDGDHKPVIDYDYQDRSFELAIPSPIISCRELALKEERDDVIFFNDEAVADSLTMTSVKIGKL